jgi:predicted nucleotidyltransferase
MITRMETLKRIQQVLEDHKEYLKEKYKVKEIGIFGSYVRGEEGKKSDLDILIDFYEKPDLFEFTEIEEYLSNILGIKVDLVMKSALKPYIGKYILKEVVYL